MTDEELVMAARGGKREAFDRLVERYWIRCRHVAWLYTGNRADAEDQAQSAFLNAYLHLEQCNAPRFRAWLDKIVHNQCRMFYRQQRRRPDHVLLFPHVCRAVSSAPDPEKRYERLHFERLMRTEVLRLPRLWRTVLWLYRIEERPIQEVARILRIGVLAAKSRLNWAQLGLESRLKRRGITGSPGC